MSAFVQSASSLRLSAARRMTSTFFSASANFWSLTRASTSVHVATGSGTRVTGTTARAVSAASRMAARISVGRREGTSGIVSREDPEPAQKFRGRPSPQPSPVGRGSPRSDLSRRGDPHSCLPAEGVLTVPSPPLGGEGQGEGGKPHTSVLERVRSLDEELLARPHEHARLIQRAGVAVADEEDALPVQLVREQGGSGEAALVRKNRVDPHP